MGDSEQTDGVRVGDGEQAYTWQERWADAPHGGAGQWGWAHHGVVVTSAGEVVTFHPGDGDVITLGSDGRLLRTWSSGLRDGHGMTLVSDGGVDSIWIADPGMKAVRNADGVYEAVAGPPAVVRFSLEGERLAELDVPPLDVYRTEAYRPTWVAVDEARYGGSGDVWVADGYGQGLVHRYDAGGSYMSTIDGAEGPGHFNCPHALLIDRRRAEPELYVADRGNARIQVFGLDGTFHRVVGAGVLNSPSALAVYGDTLVVGELFARLVVLDGSDNLLCILGEDGAATSRPGWPNALDAGGRAVRPGLRDGVFNSPHGLAVDADGNLLVAEWLIGGRLPRLTR